MSLKLYRSILWLLGPLVDLYLTYRKLKGKEDPARFKERLGHASVVRPSGRLVWIHAVSVGEALSVLPLLHQITASYPNVQLLLTTGTVTSAQLLKKRLPEDAIHQYAPIDKTLPVQRFLEHWRPDVALWVESELWPNLIIETHKTGCVMLQVNARISETSFNTWKRYPHIARNMLSCFALTLAQSTRDQERFATLGANDARFIGNIKYDAPALPSDPEETGKLIQMIGDRPLWIAASTHPGEEEQIAKAHAQLQLSHETMLTIILPRHPERGSDIANMLEQHGPVARRAAHQPITNQTQFYVADTLGELGLFFRLAGIVFMGGSLSEHGGHNPLEAARLECALLTGPYTRNFTEIYDDLSAHQAVIRVSDHKGLAHEVETLLLDHGKQEEAAQNALEFLESRQGVCQAYFEAIAPYLKPLHIP